MSIEKDVAARLKQLLDESKRLSQGNQNNQCTDPMQMQECSALANVRAELSASDLHGCECTLPIKGRFNRIEMFRVHDS